MVLQKTCWLAAIYPMRIVATLPISATLRREAEIAEPDPEIGEKAGRGRDRDRGDHGHRHGGGVPADTLAKLSDEKTRIKIIHSAVGAINESDVLLATASNAIIIGFNVRPDRNAADASRNPFSLARRTMLRRSFLSSTFASLMSLQTDVPTSTTDWCISAFTRS